MGGGLKKKVLGNKGGAALKPRLVSVPILATGRNDEGRLEQAVLVAFARDIQTYHADWHGIVVTKDNNYRAVPLHEIKDGQDGLMQLLDKQFGGQ